MRVSWRTPDQNAFIERRLPSYNQHSAAKTLKAGFWPGLISQWFERWPLPEPTPAAIEKCEGSIERARKVARRKKINQLKRVFKAAGDDSATGGRGNLDLDGPPPRRRSELQVYMSLFYDTRIRQTVIERWAVTHIPNMDFSGSSTDIPEDQIDAEDSLLFKDTKIPLCFKTHVSQELYEAEEEEIKAAVRSKREEGPSITHATVYDADEERRLELVRAYQKNIPSLKKSVTRVLKNIKHKCAGKGIIWLACPTPAKGGMPVGHFQCSGETPDGKDFETFIGAQKAEELKQLFSSWIYEIHPPADWPYFSLAASAESTPASTVGDGTANGQVHVNTISPTFDLLTLSDQPDAPSNQSNTTPGQSDTSQPGVALMDIAQNRQETTPTQASNASDQLNAPGNPPSTNVITPQPGVSHLPITTPTVLLQVDPSLSLPILGSTRPSPLRIDEPLPVIPSQPYSTATVPPQANPILSSPIPDYTRPSSLRIDEPPPVVPSQLYSQASASPPPDMLAGITNEPTWMKKKRTLDYFRNAFKFGDLHNVIVHWYQLEELLGFQRNTPAGFPSVNRPDVVGTFYKNGHNYWKDYGVDAHTLGCEITEWWTELCPPCKVPNIRFGGPIGICSLVVLMSWWCAKLKDKSDKDRADCICMLRDVDQALLTVIRSIGGRPVTSTPMLSPTIPPPSSQPRKRANSEHVLAPRKRTRSGKV